MVMPSWLQLKHNRDRRFRSNPMPISLWKRWCSKAVPPYRSGNDSYFLRLFPLVTYPSQLSKPWQTSARPYWDTMKAEGTIASRAISASDLMAVRSHALALVLDHPLVLNLLEAATISAPRCLAAARTATEGAAPPLLSAPAASTSFSSRRLGRRPRATTLSCASSETRCAAAARRSATATASSAAAKSCAGQLESAATLSAGDSESAATSAIRIALRERAPRRRALRAERRVRRDARRDAPRAVPRRQLRHHLARKGLQQQRVEPHAQVHIVAEVVCLLVLLHEVAASLAQQELAREAIRPRRSAAPPQVRLHQHVLRHERRGARLLHELVLQELLGRAEHADDDAVAEPQELAVVAVRRLEVGRPSHLSVQEEP